MGITIKTGIVLVGICNSGKTTCLHKFYDQLKASTKTYLSKCGCNKDIICSFKLHGKKCILFSGGDNQVLLLNKFHKYKVEDYDIVIFTAHTRKNNLSILYKDYKFKNLIPLFKLEKDIYTNNKVYFDILDVLINKF